MRVRLLCATLLILTVVPLTLAGEPKAVKEAKKDHAERLTWLRQEAIDAMKDEIYAVQKAGGVPNFMIRELEGFKEKGILPILPKFVPISQRYVKERKKADAELINVLTTERAAALKKGDVELAVAIRKEIAALRDEMAEWERVLVGKK